MLLVDSRWIPARSPASTFPSGPLPPISQSLVDCRWIYDLRMRFPWIALVPVENPCPKNAGWLSPRRTGARTIESALMVLSLNSTLPSPSTTTAITLLCENIDPVTVKVLPPATSMAALSMSMMGMPSKPRPSMSQLRMLKDPVQVSSL